MNKDEPPNSIMTKNRVRLNRPSRTNAFLILGVILVAFNLRPAITAVGPIVGEIQSSLHFSSSILGFLTTLPLLAFALVSPLAAKTARRFGHEWGILLGLFILLVGILIRYLGHSIPLFIGTALVGDGLLDSKLEKVTSYQNSILSEKTDTKTDAQPYVSSKSVWASPLAWQVTFYMGLQSFLFYSSIAWLPAILQTHHMSTDTAGWMLSIMQFIGLPATFATRLSP
jgi:MFS transporter, CP family, cyanate transporter